MSIIANTASSKTNAYVVTFISGKSDAVDRIEANLLREGGTLSCCDSALMHIEPALEAPQCCKKVAAKVAGLNEQIDMEKLDRVNAEALAKQLDQGIRTQEQNVSYFPLRWCQLRACYACRPSCPHA